MDSRGTTFVELMVATVLLASAASMVGSVFLSGSQQSARAQRREEGSVCLQQLMDELRNYVTADTGTVAAAPGGSWALPGDGCGSCWALQPGKHDVTARLPTAWAGVGMEAAMSYTVAGESRNGLTVRRVDARIDWNVR
ncbi:MAG: type II secretion system protein [Elusimicrobia bacterium]|nr:type II secretion system protein [Elusimicrobiota bacterium]